MIAITYKKSGKPDFFIAALRLTRCKWHLVPFTKTPDIPLPDGVQHIGSAVAVGAPAGLGPLDAVVSDAVWNRFFAGLILHLFVIGGQAGLRPAPATNGCWRPGAADIEAMAIKASHHILCPGNESF